MSQKSVRFWIGSPIPSPCLVELIFLVNNASIMSQIPMSELNEVTEEVWNSLFAVNVKDMFHFVKAVFPYMKKTI